LREYGIEICVDWQLGRHDNSLQDVNNSPRKMLTFLCVGPSALTPGIDPGELLKTKEKGCHRCSMGKETIRVAAVDRI
jgi:hypothetical protein